MQHDSQNYIVIPGYNDQRKAMRRQVFKLDVDTEVTGVVVAKVKGMGVTA